jgi:esterase/lipase superfamily enzyme
VRFAILALAALAACTPRGTLTYDQAAAGVGRVEDIFVGTMRAPDPATGEFGAGRSEVLRFAAYRVSVPPDRDLGEITWPRPGRPADAATDFVTVGRTLFDSDTAFRRSLAPAIRAQGGEATIFVHGYNNNFSEGLYRVAQLSADLDLPGEAVHFAWPSVARPLGYVTDRDSATFARDGMAALILQVEQAGADRVLLVAHSMGAQLTMEALRQLALGGRQDILGRISGVVLISPDIDVDVFRTQARAIGDLPQPFVIFTSSRDRVLRLSARLTGQRDRLGTLSDISRVDDLAVTVLDASAFNEGAGHFNVATSPALIRVLDRIGDVDRAFDRDAAGRTGLLPGAVLTVQNATRVILSPVAAIGQGR